VSNISLSISLFDLLPSDISSITAYLLYTIPLMQKQIYCVVKRTARGCG